MWQGPGDRSEPRGLRWRAMLQDWNSQVARRICFREEYYTGMRIKWEALSSRWFGDARLPRTPSSCLSYRTPLTQDISCQGLSSEGFRKSFPMIFNVFFDGQSPVSRSVRDRLNYRHVFTKIIKNHETSMFIISIQDASGNIQESLEMLWSDSLCFPIDIIDFHENQFFDEFPRIGIRSKVHQGISRSH